MHVFSTCSCEVTEGNGRESYKFWACHILWAEGSKIEDDSCRIWPGSCSISLNNTSSNGHFRRVHFHPLPMRGIPFGPDSIMVNQSTTDHPIPLDSCMPVAPCRSDLILYQTWQGLPSFRPFLRLQLPALKVHISNNMTFSLFNTLHPSLRGSSILTAVKFESKLSGKVGAVLLLRLEE